MIEDERIDRYKDCTNKEMVVTKNIVVINSYYLGIVKYYWQSSWDTSGIKGPFTE